MHRIITLLCLALVVSACGQKSDDAAVEDIATTPVDVDVSIYADAVSNPNRPTSDRERDDGRKPAAVLEFLGIEPGMVVLDMFSGGGYYTEIIAGVVGPGGRVVAHSNVPYLKYVADEFDARYANDRLPNTEVLMAENNELKLDAEKFDAVTLVLAYHDIYHEDLDSGWLAIDVPIFLAELKKGLKPGGIVGIVDHAAVAGSPSETGGTVHRIDPAIVIADMQAAGFELEARSNLLGNPDDDLDKNVFTPELRGKTDRFILRFRKPH